MRKQFYLILLEVIVTIIIMVGFGVLSVLPSIEAQNGESLIEARLIFAFDIDQKTSISNEDPVKHIRVVNVYNSSTDGAIVTVDYQFSIYNNNTNDFQPFDYKNISIRYSYDVLREDVARQIYFSLNLFKDLRWDFGSALNDDYWTIIGLKTEPTELEGSILGLNASFIHLKDSSESLYVNETSKVLIYCDNGSRFDSIENIVFGIYTSWANSIKIASDEKDYCRYINSMISNISENYSWYDENELSKNYGGLVVDLQGTINRRTNITSENFNIDKLANGLKFKEYEPILTFIRSGFNASENNFSQQNYLAESLLRSEMSILEFEQGKRMGQKSNEIAGWMIPLTISTIILGICSVVLAYKQFKLDKGRNPGNK